LPERFTVLGVIAAAVVLLSSVVDKGDTVTSEGEDGSSTESLVISIMVAKETGVVVVVDEETESRDVGEVVLLSIVAVLDVAHVLAGAKHI